VAGRRLDTASSPDGGRLVRCAWCATPFDDRAQRLRGRRRCAECGVATTDPWPDDETLANAYAAWYRPLSGRFAGRGDQILRRTRGLLARRLERVIPAGTVLDVGAGDGALLDALHARGRDAIGLERATTRRDVRAGDLDSLDERFAAIVFWHSLEHLRDPGRALERATELVLPEGLIVVAMPNAASLQARVFGDAWLALDLPRHLVHVPAEALVGRLRALGLRIERVSYARGGQAVFGWLHGLVGLLPGTADLYDAIRTRAAQQNPPPTAARAAALAAAVPMLPAAMLLGSVEAALRRGGSVYVEARRPA
jgi:SAM-dependent methyltransferase